MPRYIDAEPIEQFIANGLNRTPKEEAMGFDAIEILAEIHFAPAADVAPVVHAHWIIHKQAEIWMGILVTTFECSNCHKTVRDVGFGRYCPNCGAKMDEKENEK